MATIASTGAAVVTILSFLHSWGVLGNPDTPPSASIGAHWIGVRPAIDTANAVGDTVHLAATVTDKNGNLLYGAHPAWTSVNPAVATVAPDGSVIARGEGTTTIIATIGELAARTHIVVHQIVTSVRVGGDSAINMAEGDTRAVEARAFDVRGYAVFNRPTRWKADNAAIVSLDSSGKLVATDAGRTTLKATVDGVAAQTIVNVVPSPAAITVVKGDAQRATAAETLRDRVIVHVVDRRGRPVEGTMVRFATAPGAGVADPSVVATDADGRARTAWTLGDRPGRQRLTVTVNRVDSALTLVAEAEPSAANTTLLALHDTVAGVVGAVTHDAVGVRITDSTGHALPDVPVVWTAQDGSVQAVAERTDSLGQAHATWTLGTRAGVQHLRARIAGGVTPVSLVAVALPSAPKRITLERAKSTDPRIVNVSAVVKDTFGNPVPRTPVRLTARRGTVASATVDSDSSGRVLAAWTLEAMSGNQMLIASAGPRGVTDTLVARVATSRKDSRTASSNAARNSPRIRQSGRPPR